MSKLTQWVETVDPYYISRIVLRKGFFVGTIMSIVNMTAKPDSFLAFALSGIVAFGCYESSLFNSFFKKNKAMAVAFTVFLVGSGIFYLLFPYKFYLLIAALCFYTGGYWLIYYRFIEFKPFFAFVLMFASFTSLIMPSANLQTATSILYCSMLSLLTLFISMNIHPNLYPNVWYRATKLYLKHLEGTIEAALYQQNNCNYMQEIAHTYTVKNFKHLLPKKHLLNRMRINFHMHSINFILKHLYYSDKNVEFWTLLKEQIHQFRMAMENERICPFTHNRATRDEHEESVQKHLRIAMTSWNALCLTH